VALAKYVLALVKKEKPIPQLQASMENSLDVFLQKGRFKSFNLQNPAFSNYVIYIP